MSLPGKQDAVLEFSILRKINVDAHCCSNELDGLPDRHGGRVLAAFVVFVFHVKCSGHKRKQPSRLGRAVVGQVVNLRLGIPVYT